MNIPKKPSTDDDEFLKAFDSSGMYQFALKKGLYGTAAGTGIFGGLTWALQKYSPTFRTFSNLPIKFFLVASGAAMGFAYAGDQALIEYYRYHDRPEISGFGKMKEAERQEEFLRLARMNQWERLKESAWNNRYKLIFAGWATSMGGFIYKDYSNPHLSSVHKFGHARIAAQAVTLVSIILAFAFNEDTGPWSKKYGYNQDD